MMSYFRIRIRARVQGFTVLRVHLIGLIFILLYIFSRSKSETEMTLVLSMNPFLDPEGDPPPYQPIWESERRTKTCLSSPVPPCSSEEQFTQGTDKL